MANLKSSKKAIKVIAKKTANNHEPKAIVKNLIKDLEKAIAEGNKKDTKDLFAKFQKAIDRAVAKGLIKKNTADREKSRLAQKVKSLLK